MYEILALDELNPITKQLEVEAPAVARKALPGQFVIIRTDCRGERIPLTIADYDRDRGSITLVVQEVGKTTMQMGTMRPSEKFTGVTGPLGRPSEVRQYGTVLCVAGGFAIAPILPIARRLQSAGNRILIIIGVRNVGLLFWEDKLAAVSDELIVCTDDGSYGRKGLVTQPLKEMLEAGRSVDHVWAIGPTIRMKFCALTTEPFAVPTTVNLNSIMVDGTGMCGACRAEIGGQTRFACVDGPEFDSHQVDWDLLMARQRIHLEPERQPVLRWQRISQRAS